MDQTSTQEGTQVPTPVAEMPRQDSAPTPADAQSVQAKPAELLFAEEALGREFASKEEAQKALKNLNSMVGDQTLAKQRKAVEKISQQSGLTPEELYEVLETQTPTEPVTETPVQSIQPTTASNDAKRLTRLEVDEVVKNDPDAATIRDIIFAKSLATGIPAQEIWLKEYKPLVEVGKKSGAKKLQTNLEGQPLRATSTASDSDDTKVDFTGLNPTTGKRWTAREMEAYMQYSVPSQGL